MFERIPPRKNHLDVSELEHDSEVREIINGLDDRDGIIDIEFIAACQHQIALNNAERAFQEIDPLTKNQKAILIYEFYRTAVAYKGKMRKDDVTSVFHSHLIGAVENYMEGCMAILDNPDYAGANLIIREVKENVKGVTKAVKPTRAGATANYERGRTNL